MGMSASQAQLLSITSRMSDNELRAQIISNDKQRLATESSQVSGHYVETLQATNMQFASYDKSNNQISEKLTFNNLTRFNKLNAQYGISNLAGQLYVSENDADKFQRAIAARDPLTSFLNEQGFFYETSYFDNLDKYLVNGKVSYRGQDYHGAMTQLSTGCNIDEIKTMYFGESPTAAVNGIYHKGFEKITPDMVMYMDLVNIVQDKLDKYQELLRPALIDYAANHMRTTGLDRGVPTINSIDDFTNAAQPRTLGGLVNLLGGSLTGKGEVRFPDNNDAYSVNERYEDKLIMFQEILKTAMYNQDDVLIAKGTTKIPSIDPNKVVNSYYAGFYKEVDDTLSLKSKAPSRMLAANGSQVEDPALAATFCYSYNPYESIAHEAFIVPPFELQIDKETGAKRWYSCWYDGDWSAGQPLDPTKIKRELIDPTKIQNTTTADQYGQTDVYSGLKFSISTKGLDQAILDELVSSDEQVTAKSGVYADRFKVEQDLAAQVGYEAIGTIKEGEIWTEKERTVAVLDDNGQPTGQTTKETYYDKQPVGDGDECILDGQGKPIDGTNVFRAKSPAPSAGTYSVGTQKLLTAITSSAVAQPAVASTDANKKSLLQSLGITVTANSGETEAQAITRLWNANQTAVNKHYADVYAQNILNYVETNMKSGNSTEYAAAYEMADEIKKAGYASVYGTVTGATAKKTATDSAAEARFEAAHAETQTALRELMTTIETREAGIKAGEIVQRTMTVKDMDCLNGQLKFNTNYIDTKTWEWEWDTYWLPFEWRTDDDSESLGVGNFEKRNGYNQVFNRDTQSSSGMMMGSLAGNIIAGIFTLGITGLVDLFGGGAEARRKKAKADSLSETQTGPLYGLGSIIHDFTYQTNIIEEEPGEDGIPRITFESDNKDSYGNDAADANNLYYFTELRRMLTEFFADGNALEQYDPDNLDLHGYIIVSEGTPAFDARKAYQDSGKDLANFLYGAGYSDRPGASKRYKAMCDPDLLDKWYRETNPAINFPYPQTQTVRNVIDGGILERIFDTYGEPKQCWVDASGNDCTAQAQWYTNLFNRMREGYKALEDGLASDPKWIDYALKSGLAVMEQVDGTNAWSSMIYTNCADITERKDSTSVAIAEAEYSREMSKIQAKDKRCDMELKQIDTEHNSLQVEYDSIKAALDKNMERTLKIYSA